MVFFILLGFIDLLVGALMVAMHLGVSVSWRLPVMAAIYLMGKSIIMRGSFLSVLDFAAGIYIFLMMLGVRSALVYFFLAILVYKFVISIIMRG